MDSWKRTYFRRTVVYSNALPAIITTTTTKTEGKKMTKYNKIVKLTDNEGRKINNKIRKDSKGLYIVRNGLRGNLVKEISYIESGEYRCVFVTRRVKNYTAA